MFFGDGATPIGCQSKFGAERLLVWPPIIRLEDLEAPERSKARICSQVFQMANLSELQ